MTKIVEPNANPVHPSDVKYSSTELTQARPPSEVEAFQAGYRQGYSRATELITENVIANVAKMKETIFKKLKIPENEIKG